jgi:hypothetical protein
VGETSPVSSSACHGDAFLVLLLGRIKNGRRAGVFDIRVFLYHDHGTENTGDIDGYYCLCCPLHNRDTVNVSATQPYACAFFLAMISTTSRLEIGGGQVYVYKLASSNRISDVAVHFSINKHLFLGRRQEIHVCC